MSDNDYPLESVDYDVSIVTSQDETPRVMQLPEWIGAQATPSTQLGPRFAHLPALGRHASWESVVVPPGADPTVWKADYEAIMFLKGFKEVYRGPGSGYSCE